MYHKKKKICDHSILLLFLPARFNAGTFFL